MGKDIFLTIFITLNSYCMEELTPLETFFDDPISEFNVLHNDAKFYFAIYYLKRILINYPAQNEEVLSSLAVTFLKLNKQALHHVHRKILIILETLARQYTNLDNNDFLIYSEIYKNIRDKKIKKALPHPDLFELSVYKKLK